MAINAQTRRVLTLARTVFLISFILAVVAAGALWFSLQYKPAWYRQVIDVRMSPKQARAEAIQLADTISDSLVAGKPVEITLSDRGVTGWLAAMPSFMSQKQYSLPEGISDLAVRFDDTGLWHIGARVEQEGLRAILSVSLSVELVQQGKYIRVALKQANGGALPLPKSILEKLLNPLLHSEYESRSARTSKSLSRDTKLEMVHTVDEMYEGVLIPNQFVWPNGDRPFKINRLNFSESKLTMKIQPMP